MTAGRTSFTFKHSNVVLALLALTFLADSATAVLLALDSPIWRVSIVVRLLAQVYFMWLLGRTKGGWIILGFAGVIYSLFLLGSIFPVDEFSLDIWLANFSTVNKMLYVFLCWGVFQEYFRTTRSQQRLFRLFELAAMLIVLSIYIGFLLSVDILKSYPAGERFGYKGLIPALNEASGYLLIIFFYYLQRLYTTKRGLPMLFLIVGAAVLTGAKVALALPLLLVLLSLRWISNRRMGRTAAMIVAGVMAALVLAFVFRERILDQFAATIDHFTMFWLQGRTISSLFVSGRDLKVEDFLAQQLPQFGAGNYLFGGWDFSSYSTEMDVVDVFAFLGLIGGVVFYAGYLALLLGSMERIPAIRLVFAIVWLGVSALSGHLVFSAVNSAYLAILLTYFSVTAQRKRVSEPRRAIDVTRPFSEPAST